MTIWLEKLLVPNLLEAYLEHGYGFNFGYAVAADSIGSEDSAKDLVAALDLDGPEGPLAGAEVIHTLRFPLMPTDTVYPAMGGTTDEERAVARGDFLEFPPFNGSGVIDLPSDPQASYLYVDPTILRAGAQILRRESGGASAEVLATYRGLFMGWKKSDGTKTPPGRPDPLSMQAFRVKEADSFSPGQFNFDDIGRLLDVIGLRRDDSGIQRRIVIELDQIAQAGIVKTHGSWDGFPVRAMRITDDGEHWEVMSLAHDSHAAQERGMQRIEAGVYSAIVAPSQVQTVFTLLSMPSWPQG